MLTDPCAGDGLGRPAAPGPRGRAEGRPAPSAVAVPATAPPATTPADVRARLVAFFLELPNAPVYAATRTQARFLDPDKSPSSFDWPAFTAEVLGPHSRARLWVLTAARCEARRRAIARNLPNPRAGSSAREFCREFGVPRATFEQTVRQARARLAREWDRRGGVAQGSA